MRKWHTCNSQHWPWKTTQLTCFVRPASYQQKENQMFWDVPCYLSESSLSFFSATTAAPTTTETTTATTSVAETTTEMGQCNKRRNNNKRQMFKKVSSHTRKAFAEISHVNHLSLSAASVPFFLFSQKGKSHCGFQILAPAAQALLCSERGLDCANDVYFECKVGRSKSTVSFCIFQGTQTGIAQTWKTVQRHLEKTP